MSANYDELLDDEIRAYIARSETSYPPDATSLGIAEQRQVYDAMCADFDLGRPEGVTVTDEEHGGVPCRRYDPPEEPHATVLYCHGGGFILGGLDSHDSICAEICKKTGLRVVAVDYPLAPEHHYPEDFNAVWAAYGAVRERWPEPIVLAGDSAGGTLCASISHKGRDTGQCPHGQVLIYPSLGGDRSLPSYVDYADAPQLSAKDVAYYSQVRPDGTPPKDDPYYAALQDSDFSGLPPTVCITAQCDPLTSDSDVYCNHIQMAGGKAVWFDERGLVHGYLRARGMSERARRSFDRICRAISTLSHGAWPIT
jgi:acetyl esterase